MRKKILIAVFGFAAAVIVYFLLDNSENEFYDMRKKHHTRTGFRNTSPDFVSHGFKEVFKWGVVDRIKGKKPDKPDKYDFETVDNDGRSLRENESSFTVTWIGHSSLFVQIERQNILIDPVWSDRASPVGFIGPARYVKPGVELKDLPEIDIVIISHDHYDHFDLPTIKKLGNTPKYFIPLGLGSQLEDNGITNYTELDWWDKSEISGLELICTPAQHFSGRGLKNRNNTLWASWVILGKERRFYYGGDSGYFDGFSEIGEKSGPFDIAALPIGSYKPEWFMSPVHLSPDEALKVFQELNADIMIPIHWGTFELSDEPLDDPPKVLMESAEKMGVDKSRIYLFKHGETRIFD
ncbi:MBL fold metallo-hydrolase [candidate division KSB1 bacterium]